MKPVYRPAALVLGKRVAILGGYTYDSDMIIFEF